MLGKLEFGAEKSAYRARLAALTQRLMLVGIDNDASGVMLVQR